MADNEGGKLDHDDPIIVDNAPARFNFTTLAPNDVGSVKAWERDYTNCETLIVTLVDKEGKVSVDTYALAPDGKMVFGLASAGNMSQTEEVTLTSKRRDKLKIKVANKALKHKNATPEILESDAFDDLRLTSLAFDPLTGAQLPLSFVDAQGFKYISVLTVIKAARGH